MTQFMLECPQCRNQMKYETRDSSVIGKKKRCVYCGKAFDVQKNLVRKI